MPVAARPRRPEVFQSHSALLSRNSVYRNLVVGALVFGSLSRRSFDDRTSSERSTYLVNILPIFRPAVIKSCATKLFNAGVLLMLFNNYPGHGYTQGVFIVV